MRGIIFARGITIGRFAAGLANTEARDILVGGLRDRRGSHLARKILRKCSTTSSYREPVTSKSSTMWRPPISADPQVGEDALAMLEHIAIQQHDICFRCFLQPAPKFFREQAVE